MDKKIIIGAIVVVLVVIIGAFAFMGGSHDSDPTHLTVAAHSNIKEPEAGFNPLTGWGCGHQNYNPLVQSCLFKTDKNGSIVPDLATGYSVSGDGKTWTVNVRDDVKFSDNSTFDAEDVAFTFNTAKQTESELDLTNIANVTAVNNTCVKFNLVEARSTFIYDLRYLGIVPSDSYDNSTYGENPIGTGPYVLDHWDKGQQAIFKINDNYYGDKPYFTQITLLFPEEATWLELAKSGEIDVVPVATSALNQTVDGYQFIEKSAGRAQGVSLPYLNDTGIMYNGTMKVGNNVTADKSIREALNVGINRQTMCDEIFAGHASPEFTGVDTRTYANPDAKVADGDVSKAKQILKDGGWTDTDGDGIVEKNGLKASFDLYYPPDYLDRQSMSTVFAEQAKELGIEVKLVGADWDTIYKNLYSSAALMQQTSPDPYKSIYQQYHSKEMDGFYMNPNLYNNSASDRLMDEAMHTSDLNQADSLWSQSALVNGGGWGPAGDAPWVWIANYDYNYFIKDGIDIGKQPDGLGNDVLINICDWSRTNSTA
ncbi:MULTISPECIES: ABC transporter substrate-binding protein [Methanobrevibacter]|uniref:Peptide/nickel transport system substrate-binding protein n=1 Tax=Methanobrevibacter gottschalkii DSM 11977 TaxID=1122229 RepID=A0A3N5BP41_9EURY|nr:MULTISPECIES: ABC transporter substrate-binding protein [Methanobrevibacter]OEC96810.1 nickel ABC transporter substrate-binding protein [Methanobrevibacter sp. A27]RPF51528.1 peptide/nickel transport system substrate-binding protein [Methanobrevibacter gottschalkii DSM 11977]